ncbi:MAG: SET domain-containing protein-lysine N-methyltransferase [Chloroflexi bacterium]|nr:SET domain-containing protein-lysine N-methyltransferase [Chloroflexota bacterium]
MSWLSPKCSARELENGEKGVFARESLAQGELISVWGGQVMTRAQVAQLPEKYQHYATQVEEDFYLAGVSEEDADYFNHSCDPNAGLQGQIVLVAMRDIAPGEEICFDYAMTDGSDYDEFECHCGAPNCRKFVRGSDWRNPELWEKYRGYFMPYLQKRIDRLRAAIENAKKNPPP